MPEARDLRVVRRRPGFGGSAGAVLLFCLSMTPSLLPRHWALQGVLSAVTMAIGYGLGATVGAVARRAWPRLPVAPGWAWALLVGVAAVLVVVFLRLGVVWQRELRQLVGAEPAAGWEPLLSTAVAGSGFGSLLMVSRAVRLVTRRLAATLGRFSPQPVASVTAVGLVAVSSFGLGQGVVSAEVVSAVDRAAAATSDAVAPEVARPASRYVSGGPGSLVSWETLGGYGREFTASAVPVAELTGFAGGDVAPPVRVYVGQESAPTVADRARLAVRELERTGGFDRAVLAVIVTTGTGWVNPAVPAAMEYLHGGDSALVAIQYSHLPSWISYLADRSAAVSAATALIGAVRERLAAVPADQRPTLVVYGESLGAHGTEAAFGDLAELVAGVDGALLAGAPHSNPIWQEVTYARDPDSPVWKPRYDQQATVRFVQGATDLAGTAGRPQVVYLQNASDPIVWWSPELLYREPEWLDGARGPDVSGAMRWYPVVTFWQVSADLVTSTQAPSGHGHSYRESIADGWAALVAPPGWTDADTGRLRAVLSLLP